MTTTTMDVNLIQEGWKLLVEKLGLQKATQFVVLLERGKGNSVAEINEYWGNAGIEVNPDSILSLGSRISSVNAQVRQVKDFESPTASSSVAVRPEAQATRLTVKAAWTKLVLQAGISLIVLGVSFAIFFRESDPKMGQVAAGVIGVVVGYWLR